MSMLTLIRDIKGDKAFFGSHYAVQERYGTDRNRRTLLMTERRAERKRILYDI